MTNSYALIVDGPVQTVVLNNLGTPRLYVPLLVACDFAEAMAVRYGRPCAVYRVAGDAGKKHIPGEQVLERLCEVTYIASPPSQ